MRRFLTYLLPALVAAVLLAIPPRSAAQPAPSDTSAGTLAAADTLPPGHPNRTPYRSDRSVFEHVLAAPAYVLHYVTRPLGWAVKEAEERVPQVFEGNLPAYGVYPIFETGGTSGFAGGAVLFYNDLPWGGHSANVRGLLGSRAYNRFEGRYEMPGAFGGGTELRLRGRYFNDPRQRFYTGGNDAGEEDRTFYATGQTDLEVEASAHFSPRVETEGGVRFQRISIDPGAAVLDDEGEQRLPGDLPGVGTTHLASAEAAVALDLASQTERSVEGTRLRFGAEYGQGVGRSDGDVRFVRYRAEAVQFVPLPFLPPQRRLALRGFFQKAAPLGSSDSDGRVPFYRQPTLGGAERLRGYRPNRFQDEGALLVTAEYRWPVWNNLDALLFTEAGQVFEEYGDLGLRRFHASYGGGFHLVTGGETAFRFELAGSREGLRTLLTVRPAF